MSTLYRYVDNYDLLSLLLKLCGQIVLFCPSSPPFFLLLLHKYVHTHTHTHSLIKDSAPFINMIVTVGCILMLIACILLGVDSQTPLDESNDRSRYGAICNVSQ